jgi:hypothetical protein
VDRGCPAPRTLRITISIAMLGHLSNDSTNIALKGNAWQVAM